MAPSELLAGLRCSHCAHEQKGQLTLESSTWLVCQEPGCGRKYPIRDGFPVMTIEEGDTWRLIELGDMPPDSLPSRPTVPDPLWLKRKAQELRINILEMVVAANGGHIGGAYSAIDFMTALYFRVLNHDSSNPTWPDRDRLVFSKGHGCLSLYTCLAHSGYFRRSRLAEFGKDGGLLGGHPERGHIPGVEVTAGSLGHGLPQAVGMAMAAKMDSKKHRIFVVMSDGECNEGSVWEGFMAGSQHKLSNLTVIIDSNKLESLGRTADILNIEPLGDRLRTFGWGVREIDGHDMKQIVEALETSPYEPHKPSAIVANTVKGKGVSFMEGATMWHLRGPTKDEARAAFSELARGLRK